MPNGCQLWIKRDGSVCDYGHFCVDAKNHYARRWIWEYTHGRIADGLRVLSHCGNPACVNVEHLWLDTLVGVVAEKCRKGRQARGVMIALSKLVDAQVLDMRKAFAAGETMLSISKRFPVCALTVRDVVLRRTWMHI